MVSFRRKILRAMHFGPFKVTFRYLFRSTFTRVFPYEDGVQTASFRGLLALNMDNCVGCRACEKTCPNKTIIMETMSNGDRYPGYFSGRCLLCGICVEACHYDALFHTQEFEHSGHSREELYFSPFRMHDMLDKYMGGRSPEFLES